MTQSFRSIQSLDRSTPEGLFLGAGGVAFWVFPTVGGKVAVQLESTADRPAFAYDVLDAQPLTLGIWLGSVAPRLGSNVDKPFNRRSGILICVENRLYLKANRSNGCSERLRVFPFRLSDSVQWYRRIPSWTLNARTAHRSVRLFDSRAVAPRLSAYPARHPTSGPYVQFAPTFGDERTLN